VNTELVRRWVTALESGEYKQGVGQLVQKTESGVGYEFCCLGVAYKACRPKKKFVVNSGLLSDVDEKLTESLGLNMPRFFDHSTPQHSGSTIERDFTYLNDVEKRSFKWIAKWIRKNMLGEKGIRLR